MKLLILGGTIFVGRHLTEIALERGHEVTLFHRGTHGSDLFPHVEKLRGDRNGDLDALKNRQWDAVIDTCGYLPRIVQQSVELLRSAVTHYAFISSISAYADFRHTNMDETAPLGSLENPDSLTEITNETYGPAKAACERVVIDGFPERAFIIRPGLIVGPNDPTDRFTYWPERVAQGGDVLVPGAPDQQLQIIDVRDLATWTVAMLEQQHMGIYNAVGPDYPLTMQRVLEESKAVSHSDAQFQYVDGKWLEEQGVEPNRVNAWWMPPDASDWQGFSTVSARQAQENGLTYRPLSETIADTLAWNATRPTERPRPIGLEADRERKLLAAWKNN